MPIKLVGKPVNWKGKKVFEILCNLKNFGIGRMLVMHSMQKYPEPTFYRVVKAEPKMDAENAKGIVWLDTVFRGVKFGTQPCDLAYKQDWQLIPKDEEEKYLSYPVKEQPDYRIIPATKPFPPLFKTLIMRDRKAQGLSTNIELELPLKIKEKSYNRYRAAKPGETPTVILQKHVRPELYDAFSETKSATV